MFTRHVEDGAALGVLSAAMLHLEGRGGRWVQKQVAAGWGRVCVCLGVCLGAMTYHEVKDGVLAIEASRRVHLQLEQLDAQVQVLIRRGRVEKLPAMEG